MAEPALGTASPFDGRPISRLQIQVFLLCGLVTVFDGFDIQSIAFAAPAISTALGVPKESFGVLFSIGLVGMLVGLVVQGPIADRQGRRPMILASVTIFGAASLMTAFATSVPALVAARLVAGVGMGAALPNVIALTGEFAPLRARTRLITAMNSGLPIGGFLGGILSARLIEHWGWGSIFVVGGLAPLAIVPVLWKYLPESLAFLLHSNPRPDDKRLERLLAKFQLDPAMMRSAATTGPSIRAKFPLAALMQDGRARETILLWALFLLNMLLFYFLIAWLPTLLTTAGLPMGRAVLATAGLNLGSVLGGLVLAWLADRWGTRATLVSTFTLVTLLFLLLGLGGFATFGMVAVLTGLLGVAIGGAQLILNALAVTLYPPEMRASGIGIAGMLGRGGAIAGPVLGGILLARGVTPAILYLLLAIPAVLAALVVAGMRARSTQIGSTTSSLGQQSLHHHRQRVEGTKESDSGEIVETGEKPGLLA